MSLYSDPPGLRDFRHDKPTLLVCWWATSLCALMIILRVTGRFIRTEKLFSEDKLASLALVPLFLRMGCVHFILIHGTNNVDLQGVVLTQDQLRKRAIASGLVLASRALYAATLWILKGTILEFLRRLTDITWQRSQHITLIAIRWALVATFLAVIVSDLAECSPFNHYWQVLPDPGGQCRQGYVQLITMATCNVLTDLMLVIFPIPIIIQSHMPVRRKIQLVLLFSLSLAVVCVTLYRVPHIIDRHGLQQYRSLLASVELIFATAAANALVLGSFVRDRGVKKQRFHRRSTAAESFDRRSSNPRRATLQQQQWGSDEDLVRDLGLGVDHDLRQQPDSPVPKLYTPAPKFAPLSADNWERDGDGAQANHDMPLFRSDPFHASNKLSLFDVGGLLEDSVGTSSGSYRRGSYTSSTLDPHSPHSLPPASRTASSNGVRRGSSVLLQDLCGLPGPLNMRPARSKPGSGTELQPIPQSHQEHSSSAGEGSDLVLLDPGGLLK